MDEHISHTMHHQSIELEYYMRLYVPKNPDIDSGKRVRDDMVPRIDHVYLKNGPEVLKPHCRFVGKDSAHIECKLLKEKY